MSVEWRSDLEAAVKTQILTIAGIGDVSAASDQAIGGPTTYPATQVAYDGFQATSHSFIAGSAIIQGVATIVVNITTKSSEPVLGTARLNVGGGQDLANKIFQKVNGFTPALSGLSNGSGLEAVWSLRLVKEVLYAVPNGGFFEIEQTYLIEIQIQTPQQ